MRVIHQFSSLQTTNLHWLNSANIVLIPKKDGAEEIGDFRPISLIHAIAKIIAKVLASRLCPFMNNLVSTARSAFIKK
uniref:Reverse transcriptase domain-containing protein n=1 Tax=Triticum urartu TaxID=4572 RepID=A0A8R7JVW5_TRIUA